MKHYHNNPRQITESEFKHLQETMKEYGDLSGIVHNLNTDEVIGGNQRSEAAALLDREPVIVEQFDPAQEDGTVATGYFDYKGRRFSYRAVRWDEEKAAKANLAANLSAGQWDWDILSSFDPSLLQNIGFDKELLSGMKVDVKAMSEFLKSQDKDHADAEPQIDESEQLQKKWEVKEGDLWQIGEHLLLCGDSTKAEDVSRIMNGNYARMIFTDPTWNVAIGGDSNPRHRQRKLLENDDLSREDFSSFVLSFIQSFISSCDGDVYCVLGAAEWPVLDRAMRAGGYHWSATIIWVKDIFVLGRSKYHRRYEPIWYGWHNKNKSSFCEDRNLDDVWEIKRPRTSDEHPTMKPIELVERAINNSSMAGDLVFDPFGGSGTTMVASQNLDRVCRMIEISPGYCAVILERMQTAFPELVISKVA